MLNEKEITHLKVVLEERHAEFESIIDQFVQIFKIENVKGILPALIKELREEGKFKWSDFKRFEIFMNGEYNKTLKKLESLK